VAQRKGFFGHDRDLRHRARAIGVGLREERRGPKLVGENLTADIEHELTQTATRLDRGALDRGLVIGEIGERGDAVFVAIAPMVSANLQKVAGAIIDSVVERDEQRFDVLSFWIPERRVEIGPAEEFLLQADEKICLRTLALE